MSKQQRDILDSMLRGNPFDLGGEVHQQRRLFAEMMSHVPLPEDVHLVDDELGGVRVSRISIGTAATRGTVLYFHGGAYAIGTAALAAGLASDIARRTGTRVLSVDYSLAPEAPFPTALHEGVAAYRALLEQGVPSGEIVLAGESAGGGLALAAAIAVREADLPQPAGIYVASPWADLTLSGRSATTRAAADPSVTVEGLARRARDYAPGQDLTDGLISPVFGDLTGLAPLLIQVGGNEVLLDDATRLAANAADAGVHVTLEVTPDVPHIFVAFAALLEEADQALDVAARFIRTALTAGADA